MNRFIFPAVLLSALPCAAAAQELPLYIDHGGELSFTGTMLNDAELNDMFGGRGIVDIFGTPEIIVKDAQTGAPSPVYTSPEEYEMVFGADGVVHDRHDDLTFAEDEGSDLREDLDFAEDEGTDVREDLEFAEGEGTQTREDLTFTADEAQTPGAGFDGPKGFFSGGSTPIQPQNGTWSIQLNAPDITGCPPGVGEMAATQVARAGAANVTFAPSGWTPADLNSDYARFAWERNGPNGFYAQPYRLQAEGSGMALTVSMALVATSETRINVWSRVLMTLTPMLARMAGGAEVCSAIVIGKYIKN
ncbi:hypothetical protein [Aliiroseovarius crassostreae]|uniref:hypothetical protein n=1 Tax=Aliiroseovarius crassostreae TaxID=154981 RepID=UPI003C7B3C69